ncbi:MAG: TraB family protein, partial [Candidatus Aenigmatarchaeota archaeon]
RNGWKELDIVEAIREGKGSVLFLNLLLSIYQRQIGLEEGVTPGEEMLAAVREAESNNIDYRLVDRDIGETFDRLREELTLWEKIKLLSSAFYGEIGDEINIEDLKEKNVLNQLMAELDEEFPTVTRVFLDERNSYMVEEILEEEFEHAVVVVGAAHVEGMKNYLLEENTPGNIQEPERFKVPWMKLLKYGMPVAIILGLGYSFYQIGFNTGVKATSFWILSNGLLAMAGAIL